MNLVNNYIKVSYIAAGHIGGSEFRVNPMRVEKVFAFNDRNPQDAQRAYAQAIEAKARQAAGRVSIFRPAPHDPTVCNVHVFGTTPNAQPEAA